jgi:hypothetical protein|tara:strand:+ start:273 stop:509 length:237 start_codon:yes stop_codon:yes gene_type:complete
MPKMKRQKKLGYEASIKAKRKPLSYTKLRKAIDNKCKECIYDPHPGNGTWREQVEDCHSPDCPLYNYRPGPVADRKVP